MLTTAQATPFHNRAAARPGQGKMDLVPVARSEAHFSAHHHARHARGANQLGGGEKGS